MLRIVYGQGVPAAARILRAGSGHRGMSDIAKEVNRVMANPEINGNPVALDFSKGKGATGFTRGSYGSEYDRIFAKKNVDPLEKGKTSSNEKEKN